MNKKSVYEEGVKITKFGDKISKELTVFYNPDMKINRDMTLLFIKSYFDKPIKYCDPMAASGIREIRFLKTIPDKFSKIVCGDISEISINDMKNNLKENEINTEKLEIYNQDAINTINSDYFDVIEIDPFGSPIPFLDIACQKIKHNGVLIITATDTAALCGTYPKTTLRKYGIKINKPLWHYELGLRNLIAYSQRQASKYEKVLIPVITFSNNHFYKIFLKVEQSRTKVFNTIKNLKWVEWDKKTQDITINEHETKNSIGKTYVDTINNEQVIQEMIDNLDLIEDSKEILKLLNKLKDELNTLGFYNTHKLQKEFKIDSKIKFKELFDELENNNFKYSRVHNDKYGIKTHAKSSDIIKIIRKY